MNINEFEKRIEENAKILKNSMQVPDTLSEIKKEKMTMKKLWIKKTAVAIVSVAAAFTLVLNCVPSLAEASAEIPYLGSLVKVITFNRFEVNEKNYKAEIVTPKIEGLLDKALEEKLNEDFQEYANHIIFAFEQEVKELKKEFGEDFHIGIEANYTIRTDNEDILAIDTYIVNTAASSSTKHKFYNIDKKTGELIKLKNMFKENADYITPVSEYIISQMKKEEDIYWLKGSDFDGFEKIKEDQNFFINEKGNIVISFDKYEVAPGAYGCPEFEIPNGVIEDLLK